MINLLGKWLYLISLDLVNLVLATTWYTFMGKSASSATAEIYKQAYSSNARTLTFFHQIKNLHQNIKFTMKEESNGELALDTL